MKGGTEYGAQKTALKEIEATVMPQTAEALKILMEETELTIGEVIDRLTLQMCPDKLEHAVLLATEQVMFSISNLPDEQAKIALTETLVFLAGFVPADRLKGLEEKALMNRAQRLEEYKKHVDMLPEKEADRLMKELSILEKIREQE